MGNVYDVEGRETEAVPLFERAIALYEAHFGPKHVSAANAWQGLGSVYVDLERADEALAAFERAHAIWSESAGADHSLTAYAIHGRGRALALRGDVKGATAAFERAMQIRADDPAVRAETEAELAVLLAGIDSDRSRALGEAAVTAFLADGNTDAAEDLERELATVHGAGG